MARRSGFHQVFIFVARLDVNPGRSQVLVGEELLAFTEHRLRGNGPPSSAYSGRNCGGRTIQSALRAGRAIARIPENQLAASPPFTFPATPIDTHRSAAIPYSAMRGYR
jgi:hypothetical protein